MSVLHLDGSSINWLKPPKPTDMVKWSKLTTGGKTITGSFRTIAHLDDLDILATQRFGVGIRVFQPPFNTGVPQSAGTHDYDAMLDGQIPGVSWSEQQDFFRANGAFAWYRKPPTFSHHMHWGVLPPQSGVVRGDDFRDNGFTVGKYVDGGYSLYGRATTSSSQLDDYYQHRTGLKGHYKDPSWFPANIRSTIFDLNAYIKERAPKAANTLDVLIGHFSGQWSRTPEQWAHDAKKVFSQGYMAVTGTEVGENPNYRALARIAKAKGYKIKRFRSNWVAVKISARKVGTFRWGYELVAKAAEVYGPGHDSSFVWASFTHKTKGVGKVSIIGSHYPTKGRPDGDAEYQKNLKWTKLMAARIGSKAKELGKGEAIVFYGGDQNIVDKHNDMFFGQPLTSCWDDLKKWPSTGHGNIDVIARFNRDARVRCVGGRAFTDKQMFLWSDHHLIQARYRITLKETK